MPVSPPRWPDETLKAERDLAEQRFILGRQEEGPAAFYATWEAIEPGIRSAFKTTKNLRQIEGHTLVADKHLWQILRYVCAPRISEEDLWTLVGKKFKAVPAAFSYQPSEPMTLM